MRILEFFIQTTFADLEIQKHTLRSRPARFSGCAELSGRPKWQVGCLAALLWQLAKRPMCLAADSVGDERKGANGCAAKTAEHAMPGTHP